MTKAIQQIMLGTVMRNDEKMVWFSGKDSAQKEPEASVPKRKIPCLHMESGMNYGEWCEPGSFHRERKKQFQKAVSVCPPSAVWTIIRGGETGSSGGYPLYREKNRDTPDHIRTARACKGRVQFAERKNHKRMEVGRGESSSFHHHPV